MFIDDDTIPVPGPVQASRYPLQFTRHSFNLGWSSYKFVGTFEMVWNGGVIPPRGFLLVSILLFCLCCCVFYSVPNGFLRCFSLHLWLFIVWCRPFCFRLKIGDFCTGFQISKWYAKHSRHNQLTINILKVCLHFFCHHLILSSSSIRCECTILSFWTSSFCILFVFLSVAAAAIDKMLCTLLLSIYNTFDLVHSGLRMTHHHIWHRYGREFLLLCWLLYDISRISSTSKFREKRIPRKRKSYKVFHPTAVLRSTRVHIISIWSDLKKKNML